MKKIIFISLLSLSLLSATAQNNTKKNELLKRIEETKTKLNNALSKVDGLTNFDYKDGLIFCRWYFLNYQIAYSSLTSLNNAVNDVANQSFFIECKDKKKCVFSDNYYKYEDKIQFYYSKTKNYQEIETLVNNFLNACREYEKANPSGKNVTVEEQIIKSRNEEDETLLKNLEYLASHTLAENSRFLLTRYEDRNEGNRINKNLKYKQETTGTYLRFYYDEILDFFYDPEFSFFKTVTSKAIIISSEEGAKFGGAMFNERILKKLLANKVPFDVIGKGEDAATVFNVGKFIYCFDKAYFKIVENNINYKITPILDLKTTNNTERQKVNLTYKDGSRYEGYAINNIRDGFGTFTSKEGNKYVGDYKNDKRDGKGVITMQSGEQIIGNWVDGTLIGNVTIIYVGGGIYKGPTVDLKKEGKGTLTSPNGDKYVGDFKNDEVDGYGILTKKNGTKQEGMWKAGKFVEAKETTNIDNKQRKKINLKYANGCTYEGYAIDDLPDGFGTFTFVDGTKYVGDFKNGKGNGKGMLIYVNGDQLIGNWANDLIVGEVTYIFKDGRIYYGQLLDGKREGKGTLTSPNGDKYVGDWKNDTIEGYGVLTKKDGTVQDGMWKAGVFVGKKK